MGYIALPTDLHSHDSITKSKTLCCCSLLDNDDYAATDQPLGRLLTTTTIYQVASSYSQHDPSMQVALPNLLLNYQVEYPENLVILHSSFVRTSSAVPI